MLARRFRTADWKGGESQAHPDRSGDGHRRPEPGGPLDDGAEGEGDQDDLEAPVEREYTVSAVIAIPAPGHCHLDAELQLFPFRMTSTGIWLSFA